MVRRFLEKVFCNQLFIFFHLFFCPLSYGCLLHTYLRTYYLANLSLIAGLPFSQPVSFFWAKHRAPRASKQSTRQTWINSFVAARHFTTFEDIVTQHTSHISRCSARGVCSNARILAPQSIIYHSIHKENLQVWWTGWNEQQNNGDLPKAIAIYYVKACIIALGVVDTKKGGLKHDDELPASRRSRN